MNKIYILLVTLTYFSCTTDQPTFELKDGLYISEVVVLSYENGDFQPFEGHVVTEGGEIIYVGKTAPRVTGNYQPLDGKGKYLIPGLIDSHVHAEGVLGMLPHHVEQNPELASQFNEQLPRSYLYYGFTTLINLGGISEEHLEFFNSQPLKPELYHTGRSGTSVANGYPMNFVPEEFRFESTPNFIYLETQAESIPDRFNPADHTPQAVVERIKKSGAVAVKAYYERGFHGMDKLPVPTREIIDELQQQAHNSGLVLTVHGNSLEAHSFLAEAGVDVIAHGLWNWEKYFEVPNDSLPTEIREILDKQIEKGIGYNPTLTVIEGERLLADPEFLNDPRLEHVLPAGLIEWYKTEEGQWFTKELFGDYPAEEVNRIYGNIQAHGQHAVKYLSDHGGLILFGTDTPSGPIYGNPPGYNGYMEIKLMHEAGVPLNKILESATVNNAKMFKLDSLGASIEAGKRANMLILTRNPLAEVEAYDNIETVILLGKLLPRDTLSVPR